MDTKPQRDDSCFAGDSAAYRKAYKAWHAHAKRERDAADRRLQHGLPEWAGGIIIVHSRC